MSGLLVLTDFIHVLKESLQVLLSLVSHGEPGSLREAAGTTTISHDETPSGGVRLARLLTLKAKRLWRR